MVIAYEPIWAIGTGKSADANIADEICGVVRSTVENYTAKKFLKLFVFNTVVLLNQKTSLNIWQNVDGALVGASLEADSFLALLDAVK